MYGKITTVMTSVLGAMTLLSACAHKGPEIGDSVRHMTGQQIYNLDAAYNPDPAPVTGADVYKLDEVLEAHRNNAEDPTEDRGALTTRY